MRVWWLTLASTFVICYIAGMYGRKIVTREGVTWRADGFLSMIACIILILFAGLRSSYGIGDTGAYVHSFNNLTSDFYSGIEHLFSEGGKDKGFTFISLFIKDFISEDEHVFLLIMSVITIGFIFLTFYNHVRHIELAVFLFITSGCYLVTMNGIRQYIVAAIMFAAFPWIEERKWYLYIPLALLMSTIHQSCIIFIPIYFVVNQKAWGKITYTILLVGIGLFVTYPITGPIIAELLQESQYSEYSGVIASTGAGANLIRVFVMAVPVLLSYLGRRNKHIREEKYYNIVLNFSVINVVAMLLATRYWIYARFNMYFMVYMIILLIWCIEYLFDYKNRKIVYLACLLCYGIYFWYEMSISLGLGSGYNHFFF